MSDRSGLRRQAPRGSRSDDAQTTVFRCDRCGKAGKITPPGKPWESALLRIRCRCGHSFDLLVERRVLLRRQTRLRGTYRRAAPATEEGTLTILDLSVGGLGFVSDLPHTLQVGDELWIDFLRKPGERRDQRHAVVRRVSGQRVGVEFIDAAPAADG